jgi:hypothetical protein
MVSPLADARRAPSGEKEIDTIGVEDLRTVGYA